MGLYKNIFDAKDFDQPEIGFEKKPTHNRYTFIREKVKGWAGHSAVSIGAVNFRQVAADTHLNPIDIGRLGRGKGVEYAVPGQTDTIFYPKPRDITGTNTFEMLKMISEGKYEKGGQRSTTPSQHYSTHDEKIIQVNL